MRGRAKAAGEATTSRKPLDSGERALASKASGYGNGFMQERLAERAEAGPHGAVGHVRGMASLPSGNFGPPPRVEDGNPEQGEVVRKAVTEARRMAAVGLGVLRAGASTYGGRRMLESHFHTTDPAALATASQALTSTLTGMNGELPIEVEASSETLRGPARAFVYGGPFAAWSDIHLTPLFFSQGAQEQGATVLHESTHKFADTVDHAYGGDSAYESLTPEEALENADSYAMFCRQHLVEKLKVEEQAQRHRVDEAVKTHGEEAWLAWEAGRVVLGKDGFTTSEGIELPIGVVKGIVLERFSARFPKRYQDIVTHLEASRGSYRPVICSDGYAASAELVRVVGDEEML